MEPIICEDEEELMKELLLSETLELTKKIEKYVVFHMYPQARQIIKTMLYPQFRRAITDRNDRGLIYFLYGDYHTGKSHLLSYFVYLVHKMQPEVWEKAELPIIKIDLNNHIKTARDLLLFLLEKLGRPIDPNLIRFWHKTNTANVKLQQKLIKLLESLGTRMLILDECQKLLVAKNPDTPDIFELLKDLSTRHNWSGKLRTQMVLCGTNNGIPLLQAADWIQGRTKTCKLGALDISDYATFLMKLYRGYISQGVSNEWNLVNFNTVSKKKILDKEKAQYLYSRTKGKVGLTADLLRNSILLALERGRKYPQKADFEAIRLTEKSYVFSNRNNSSA